MEMKINLDLLKKLRKEKAWPQDQLAEISGLSLRTIQRIEKSGNASLESKKALASAFGIKATELDENENNSAITDKETENFYFRVVTGTKLTEIIGGAYAYRMNHDNPKTEEETELIARSVRTIEDWGEFWPDIEADDRVKASFALTQLISELEEKGFWVFGLRTNEEYPAISGDKWPVANVSIMRFDNPQIIKLEPTNMS
jgi:transcriptional regulator with XRE-family HTH domain